MRKKISIAIMWFIVLAGISLIFFAVAKRFFTEQEPEWTKNQQATKEAEMELTASYRTEVRSAIELYHIKAGGFDSQRKPDDLSAVVKGPYLEFLLSNETSGIAEYLTLTKQINITDVRVLEYTPSRFIAIGCGVLYEDKITLDGKYIESLPIQDFENIYVFSQDNGNWKVVVAYDFRDPQSIIRDLQHATGWEGEYAGDLVQYFPREYGCSLTD